MPGTAADRPTTFSRVGSISGDALPNTASVTTISAAFTRHRGRPLRFQIRRHQQRREPFADGHGFIDRARRTLTQHAHPVGDALELADQVVDAAQRRFAMLRRQQFDAGLDVPLAQAC